MPLVLLLGLAIHSSYVGSKVVVSLFALDLGASQVTVGVLAACYAVVPLMLGVYSGRSGVRAISTGSRPAIQPPRSSARWR